ncbi:MAG: hypothetical protein WD358_01230 [Nitriliruptoraceae bacterium]
MTNGVVRTVLGDVEPTALGQTLIHEHLILSLLCYWTPGDDVAVASARLDQDNLATVRRNPFAVRRNLVIDEIDVAIDEVSRFRVAGGGALLEVTSTNVGRDVVALRLISEATGVHVVASTGYYIGLSHPRGFEERTIESLTDEMVTDLTEGVDGTGICAGVIGEIGVGSCPMTDGERKMLQAAAAAQAQVGAGMIVHPAPGVDSVFEITEVLTAAGALMDKVVISHLDERFMLDGEPFDRLAATGVIFGFDTFGRELYYASRGRQHPSDDARIERIRSLVDKGWADRIGLAQDVCIRHELRTYGGQGYDHVLDHIVPRMIDAGIAQEAITTMLTTVPMRVATLG